MSVVPISSFGPDRRVNRRISDLVPVPAHFAEVLDPYALGQVRALAGRASSPRSSAELVDWARGALEADGSALGRLVFAPAVSDAEGYRPGPIGQAISDTRWAPARLPQPPQSPEQRLDALARTVRPPATAPLTTSELAWIQVLGAAERKASEWRDDELAHLVALRLKVPGPWQDGHDPTAQLLVNGLLDRWAASQRRAFEREAKAWSNGVKPRGFGGAVRSAITSELAELLLAEGVGAGSGERFHGALAAAEDTLTEVIRDHRRDVADLVSDVLEAAAA